MSGAETVEGLFEGLLDPIPGAEPAGRPLRFGPEHEAIEAARREDSATLPRGVWEHDLKRADWDEVIALSRDALATASKDLQVAAWLVEAAARRDGCPGAVAGVGFLADLLATWWDDLYPADDGEEDSPRFSPLVWLDGTLARFLQTLPLVEGEIDGVPRRLSWTDHVSAGKRDAARRGGASRVSGPGADEFDALATSTPLETLEEIDRSLVELDAAGLALADLVGARAGDRAPAMSQLHRVIGDLQGLLGPILGRRRRAVQALQPPPAPEAVEVPDLDPAPLEPFAAAPSDAHDAHDAQGWMPSEIDELDRDAHPPGVADQRAEAYRALSSIAAQLRRIEPQSLTPYLIERAVRWEGMTLAEVIDDIGRDGGGPEIFNWLIAIQAKR